MSDAYDEYMRKTYSTYGIHVPGHRETRGDPAIYGYFFCECGEKIYISCDQAPRTSREKFLFRKARLIL